jgi:hypothetical protein
MVKPSVVPQVVEKPQENTTGVEDSNFDVKSVSGEVEEVKIPDERKPKKNDDIPLDNHILRHESPLNRYFQSKVEIQTESINVSNESNVDFAKNHGIMDPKDKIIYGDSSNIITRVYHRDSSVPVASFSEVALHVVPPKLVPIKIISQPKSIKSARPQVAKSAPHSQAPPKAPVF